MATQAEAKRVLAKKILERKLQEQAAASAVPPTPEEAQKADLTELGVLPAPRVPTTTGLVAEDIAAGQESLPSFARGTAQGATFNTADEIAGAVGAAADFATGKITLDQFTSTYSQRVETSRAAFEAAREASPGAFLAGEIFGGVATTAAATALTGGAAAPTLLGAIGRGAALGAGAGALFGFGGAEGLAEVPGAVAKGALLGGALGVAGPLLGAAGRGVAGVARKARGISPKSIAADFRSAAGSKSGIKREFSDEVNKSLEKGIEGLQKRGVLPSDRDAFFRLSRKEIHTKVESAHGSMGRAIGDVVKLTDDTGVEIGVNIIDVKQVKSLVKKMKAGNLDIAVADALDSVDDILENRIFNASDLRNLKQDMDALIEPLKRKTTSLAKRRVKELTQVRRKLKEVLEDKVDEAASKNPEIKALLDELDVDNFASLNDEFANAAVTKKVVADAAGVEDLAEGLDEIGLRGRFLETISNEVESKGLVRGILGTVRAAVSGETSEKVFGGIRKTIKLGRQTISVPLQVAEQVQKRNLVVAQQVYNSLNNDSELEAPEDVRLHIQDIFANPVLSPSQKAQAVNSVQQTGRINPENVPEAKRKLAAQELERQLTKELEARIQQGLEEAGF